MDQTQLQQQIAEYYSKLPAGAQATFSSMKWMDTLQTICKKYTLSNEQIQTLGTETTLVLLGIVPIEQYVENLMKEVVLPADSMTKMIGEIEDTVLRDVRPELEQAYKSNLSEIEELNKQTEVSSDPKFASLPLELQSAIAESDYQKKLYDIGTKYKLQVEKMGKLEELTIRFIKGEVTPSQYENSLALELDLEAEKARAMATEVNSSILQNIREYMRAFDADKSNEHTTSIARAVRAAQSDSAPLPPYAVSEKEQVKVMLKQVNTPMPMNVDNLSMPKSPEVGVPESHAQIYRDAGIEILDDSIGSSTNSSTERGQPEKKVDTVNLLKSFHEEMKNIAQPKAPEAVEVKEEVKKEVVVPQKSGLEIAKEKLEGFTTTQTTVSDHSLTKTTDPYHEAIEG